VIFLTYTNKKGLKINHLGNRSEIAPAENGSINVLFRALDYQVVLKAHFGGPLKFANSLQTRERFKEL
jgi:hypothetical protein